MLSSFLLLQIVFPYSHAMFSIAVPAFFIPSYTLFSTWLSPETVDNYNSTKGNGSYLGATERVICEKPCKTA